MRIAVHQPQYLPWIGYFHKMAHCDLFVYLDDVQYKKREFQNRNRIRTPDGFIWLTVPVITKGKYHQNISEVKIDPTASAWQQEHLRSINLNYSRTPYYKEYIHFFEKLYNNPWHSLMELNLETIKIISEITGLKTPTEFSSKYSITTFSTQRIIELCRCVGANEYLSGAGGKDYLDEKLFQDSGIKLLYQEFNHPTYPQAYEGFIPYLSAIDLLFNIGGSESAKIIFK